MHPHLIIEDGHLKLKIRNSLDPRAKGKNYLIKLIIFKL